MALDPAHGHQMHEFGSVDVMRLDQTLGQPHHVACSSSCISMRTSLEEGIKLHRFAGIFPEQFSTEAGRHREAMVAADQRMAIRCFRDDLAGFVHDLSHVPPPIQRAGLVDAPFWRHHEGATVSPRERTSSDQPVRSEKCQLRIGSFGGCGVGVPSVWFLPMARGGSIRRGSTARWVARDHRMKAYFDNCIESGRVRTDLGPPSEMVAVEALLTSATRWHDRIGHEQIFMAKPACAHFAHRRESSSVESASTGPGAVDVDTLMGVLDQGRCRCIDCLCFWAPRNTTSTAPARPLALGPFLFRAIACPPLLRFTSPMPRVCPAGRLTRASAENES